MPNDARFTGTGRTGKLRAAPARIARVLGAADDMGDPKVTMIWCLEEVATGAIVSLYEWKSTTAYHGEGGQPPPPELVAQGVGFDPLPTPLELRSCDEPVELQLGGGDVAASKRFVAWLHERLVTL